LSRNDERFQEFLNFPNVTIFKIFFEIFLKKDGAVDKRQNFLNTQNSLTTSPSNANSSGTFDPSTSAPPRIKYKFF
jgi:hypothetical protein